MPSFQSIVSSDPLPRAAVGLLSPFSGVMTLCWKDSLPPPVFLAQQKVQHCALFYFYLPWGSESAQGAALSQGMTTKHKTLLIVLVTGWGGGCAQAWRCLGFSGGSWGKSSVSDFLGAVLSSSWSSNILHVCSWRTRRVLLLAIF